MEVIKNYRSNQIGYAAVTVGIVITFIIIVLGIVFWKIKTANNPGSTSPVNTNQVTQADNKTASPNKQQTVNSGDPQLDADIQAIDAKLGKLDSEAGKISVSSQEPGGD